MSLRVISQDPHEYEAQLQHADLLIKELVEERDSLHSQSELLFAAFRAAIARQCSCQNDNSNVVPLRR